MTDQEWFDYAEKNKDILKQFVSNYHPKMTNRIRKDLPITAPNAELARTNVVRSIRDSPDNESPLEKFDAALKDKSVNKLMSVLNGAWFGVPESTLCWNIKGFTEAVNLLEDPPYDDEELENDN